MLKAFFLTLRHCRNDFSWDWVNGITILENNESTRFADFTFEYNMSMQNWFWRTRRKCGNGFGVEWVNAEMILEYNLSMHKWTFGVQRENAGMIFEYNESMRKWFWYSKSMQKWFGVQWVNMEIWVLGTMYVDIVDAENWSGNKFSCLYTFNVKQCCCYTAHAVSLTLGWMLSSNMAQNADSGTKFPKYKNKSYIYIFTTKPNVSVCFFLSSELKF